MKRATTCDSCGRDIPRNEKCWLRHTLIRDVKLIVCEGCHRHTPIPLGQTKEETQ